MVIDGRMQVVGDNKASVHRDIESAASQAKPAKVALQWVSPTRLRIGVQLGDSPAAQVLLAITEDGLTTQVGKGENRDRTLQHARVVRQMRVLGMVSKGEFASSVELAPKPGWNTKELKVAVLVQQNHQGAILGAASTQYPAQGVHGR